ncbi:MAG: hypothetical protein WCK77_01510 [Verrucomicrobiota bacterium]
MIRSIHLALLAVSFAFLTPFVEARDLVPFSSNGVAQLLAQPVPGGTVAAVDSGRATLLGNFTSVYDLHVSLAGAYLVFDGTFTSTASSGGTITFDVHVAVSLLTGGFAGEFSAIGGTARFKGISGGRVTTWGVANLSYGTFDYTAKGFLPSIGSAKQDDSSSESAETR